MVFDVDKLKEALKTYEDSNDFEHYLYQHLADAARMVVAGQPLWWCEVHEWPSIMVTYCGRPNPENCRMVEGWWMPTGGRE